MHNAKNVVTPRVGVAALLVLGRGASRRDRGEEEENILIIMAPK